MKTNFRYINNEKGQALLFVIVALTVALAVGIAVSSRTIASLKRTTSTDTSTKVYSAAEGGVEWFLRQPTSVLSALAAGNAACPAGAPNDPALSGQCILTFTPVTGDNITARALITVSTYKYNSPASYPTAHRIMEVDTGEAKEVTLNGSAGYYSGRVDICWISKDSAVDSDIYIDLYNTNGITDRRVIQNRNTSHSGSEGGTAALRVTASGAGYAGYSNCYRYTIAGGATHNLGLRVKSMFARSKVGIFPIDNVNNFPSQGYQIISKGELFENNAIKETKTVITYRSYPYMPSIFDYAIYSDGVLQRY